MMSDSDMDETEKNTTSDDLIKDAIMCLKSEGWDNEAGAVAELVAEIKHLRETYDDRLRDLQDLNSVIAAKDIELDNAMSDLKHEKERVEIMHLRRLNELRQMNELGTQNKDLMANCNQLRDRCWKAERELATTRAALIKERNRYLVDFIHEYDDIQDCEPEAKEQLARELPEIDWSDMQ